MPYQSDDLGHLIACPTCDALVSIDPDDSDARVSCERCHTALVTPSRRAGLKIMGLAAVSVALVYGAATQPFLSIKRFGFSRDRTLIETALAFEGALLVLSLAVLALILVLPLVRLLLTIYVLAPLTAGRKAFRGARTAFRLAEALRPWSMAEIFALGAGVALIKIADLAHVTLGPAFWMFAVLVVLLVVQNTLTCRFSIWKALEA